MVNESARLLIAERLALAQARRVRQEQSWVFWFTGARKPGEIAEFHFRKARQGDARPEGGLHWESSLNNLRAWFEAATERTGVNVRRWKQG